MDLIRDCLMFGIATPSLLLAEVPGAGPNTASIWLIFIISLIFILLVLIAVAVCLFVFVFMVCRIFGTPTLSTEALVLNPGTLHLSKAKSFSIGRSNVRPMAIVRALLLAGAGALLLVGLGSLVSPIYSPGGIASPFLTDVNREDGDLAILVNSAISMIAGVLLFVASLVAFGFSFSGYARRAGRAP